MQTIVERPSASGGAPRHQKLFHSLVSVEFVHVGADDLRVNVNREVYSYFHFFPLGRLRGLFLRDDLGFRGSLEKPELCVFV